MRRFATGGQLGWYRGLYPVPLGAGFFCCKARQRKATSRSPLRGRGWIRLGGRDDGRKGGRFTWRMAKEMNEKMFKPVSSKVSFPELETRVLEC